MTTSSPATQNETDWSFAKILPEHTIRRQTPDADDHSRTIIHAYTTAKEIVSDILLPQESTPATSRSKTIFFTLSCCFSILLLVSIFYQIHVNRDTARKKYIEQQKQIQDEKIATYHISELSDVPVFFDITLIKSSGSGTRMAAYGKKKVILDTTHQTIYLLSTDTKQAEILAGPDSVKDAQSLAIHGNSVYILHADGIAAIHIMDKKTEIVVPHDTEWGSIAGLGTYGGNLYLLDAIHQKIWKYIATDDGFSDRQEYLQEGVPVSVSPDARIMIDGSVWVKNNTEVLKFGGGIADSFAVSGMSDGDMLHAFDALSSSDEENFVYVLDKASGRIVILEKSGIYHGQYHWDGFRTVDDIIASEEERKLFALQGSKIYAIELK